MEQIFRLDKVRDEDEGKNDGGDAGDEIEEGFGEQEALWRVPVYICVDGAREPASRESEASLKIICGQK